MAIPSLEQGRGRLSEIVRRGTLSLSVLIYFLLFPALALWGGSTNLINWGPGLLLAGAACLLLLDKDRNGLRGGFLHTLGFLLLLGLLFVRARYSADVSATSNNNALLAMAAAGFLIGRLAGATKSRAMLTGLALVLILNLICSAVQVKNPEWNLIYPLRTGGLPSGLFAHYSYSAAFCLGGAGLLISGSYGERAWLKAVFISGAICALVTIPLSLSRGGNLALAFMIACACSLVLARAFWKSKAAVSMWLPAITLLALIVIFGVSIVPLIGRNQGSGGFYGDGVRIDFWNAAAQISTNHPWLGGGPGSFAWEVYHVMDGLTVEPGMVHNEALQMAVDYGYPSLIFMAALILIPVLLCFWRFVNRTDSSNTSWAAVGLVGMVFQSNFESIFHAAPGAFIAALSLGRISRGLWNSDSISPIKIAGIDFLSAVKSHVDDYFSGDARAVHQLADLLGRSKDDSWRKCVYRLAYWSKVHNEEALRQAMMNLGTRSRREIAHLSEVSSPRAWSILGILAIAACALPAGLSGARLSLALADAWVPVYHPQGLSVSNRFELLIRLVENNRGLGIDRMALSTARDCIYQYKDQESREKWADNHRTRILRAMPGWRTDPGTALQIAEIIGWTGDVESAMRYYNHAISAQGGNEALFMAHAFKGQYLYELSITSGAAGETARQKFFARQAVECFIKAGESGKAKGWLPPSFLKMMRECEALERSDM